MYLLAICLTNHQRIKLYPTSVVNQHAHLNATLTLLYLLRKKYSSFYAVWFCVWHLYRLIDELTCVLIGLEDKKQRARNVEFLMITACFVLLAYQNIIATGYVYQNFMVQASDYFSSTSVVDTT
ncbi:hypothetical protein ACJX0J_023119, partial [Zea mays]